jgi:CBS domain-containing protein
MKVKDLMTRSPKTCSPDASLTGAARTMAEQNCGILPVVEAGRTVGILTDRDVCLAFARFDRGPSKLRVADAMSRGVHFVRAEDSIGRALQLMRRWRVRRLPVLAPDGSLEGILSLGDIALLIGAGEAFMSDFRDDLAHTLHAISERQRPTPAPPPPHRPFVASSTAYV